MSKSQNNNKIKIQYKQLIDFFKPLSIIERKRYLIELFLDVYFLEYDESKPIG